MKLSPYLPIAALACCVLSGCSSTDVPNTNAPAAKGAGGVPVLSEEQLKKLPSEQQEKVRQDQTALQQAAAANQHRRSSNGQMTGGGG